MGFWEFLFGLILVIMGGGVALTVVGVHLAGKGLKRLAGYVRDRRALPGERQESGRPVRPAEDVIVEPIDVPEPEPEPAWRTHSTGPVRPGWQARQATVEQADYVHLDVDRGADAAAITEVMRRYEGDAILGERATAVIETLKSADRRCKSLFATLDGTFQRNTISWDRFATPAQAGLDTILRNAATLANRIQAFDTVSYQRLVRDAERLHDERSASREERLRLYREMLGKLDALQETNDGLLLELDKLSSELSQVSGTDDASDLIIEEIRRLVDEAKYYRQA